MRGVVRVNNLSVAKVSVWPLTVALAVVGVVFGPTTAAFAQFEDRGNLPLPKEQKVIKDYRTITEEIKSEWRIDAISPRDDRLGRWAPKEFLIIESTFNKGSEYDIMLMKAAEYFNEVAGTEVVKICRECTAHFQAKLGGKHCINEPGQYTAGYVNESEQDLVMCRAGLPLAVMVHELAHTAGFPHSKNPGLMNMYSGYKDFTNAEKRLIRQIYKEMK